MLDVSQLRKDFPILALGSAEKPLVYLDSAATTQKPQVVLNRLSRYYQTENANINRGAYDLAAKATDAYEAARKTVQNFIGAAKSEEIIFVKGTTEAINCVATSAIAPLLAAGDEIVISAMEHHANLLPWQIICKQHQAHLKVIPISDAGELDVDAYQAMLTPKTKIVALTHISNSLGTINPVEQMIEMAHQQGIPFLLDAAQSVPHQAIDVQALGCDFLAFSGHKLYGPTGIGVLYAKEEQLNKMSPYQYGGDMIRMVSYQDSSFAAAPHKFEAGTPHIAGAVGLAAAIDYVSAIGMDAIQAHTEDLTSYAKEKLQEVPDLQIIGQAKHASSILSFSFSHIHPHDISTLLNEAGIAIRAGHHCTMPLMRRLGLPGTARASFGLYNTKEEVDRLTEALKEVQQIFA